MAFHYVDSNGQKQDDWILQEIFGALKGFDPKTEVIPAGGISKHYGPGPHDNGTDQSVHGKPRPGRIHPGQGQLFSPGPIKRDFDAYMQQRFGDSWEEFTEYDEQYTRAYEAWVTWGGSKEMRLAAMQELGFLEAEIPADPHVTSRSPGFNLQTAYDPELIQMGSLLYMDGAINGGTYGTLYRAVDTISYLTEEEQAFWDGLNPGQEFDAPLLATLNMDPIVGPSNMLDKFGTNVLLKIKNAAGIEGDISFSNPFWSEDDESMWYDDLGEQLSQDESELEEVYAGDEEEMQYKRDEIADVRAAIEVRKATMGNPNATQSEMKAAIRAVHDALETYGVETEYMRFEGMAIDEAINPDLYYEWHDYDQGPREVITGGRFRVTSIDSDPRGVYDRIVTVERTGAFDPITGAYISNEDISQIEKKRPILLVGDEWLGLKAMKEKLDAADS